MSVDDRVGLAAHVVSRDDKLCRTFSVPVHASVQNVSQVWRAGPLRVRLAWGVEERWVVLEAECWQVAEWAKGLGLGFQRVARWMQGVLGPSWTLGSALYLQVRVTPALDRFLVELVDVIADVRRAAGTVQLELEGLEEEGDDVRSTGV